VEKSASREIPCGVAVETEASTTLSGTDISLEKMFSMS